MPPGDQPFIITFYSKLHERTRSAPTLDEILNYPDIQLERKHDYIQILFPLPEASPVNPYAPILTPQIRAAFLSDASLRANLLAAFTRMAAFYGFRLDGDAGGGTPSLVPLQHFDAQADETWRTRFDHNHLRITRIIRCLRILGLEDVAKAFYAALKNHADGRVGARSLMFWQRAADRGLWLRPDEDDEGADGVEWLK